MRYSYLFFFLVICFFFFLAYNNTLKQELSKKTQTRLIKENQLKQIRDLKVKWKSKKSDKNRLEAILKSSDLQKSVQRNKASKKNLRVTLVDLDKNSLKLITKKLFENSYKIKSFTLTREGKHKANFEFGVEF